MAVVLGAGLLGCPQRYSISVEPGSTRDGLAFRFSSGLAGRGGAAVSRVEVRSCPAGANDSGTVMWAVTYPGRGRVRTVRYGQLPPDFSPAVAPRPLTPGCYVVQANPDEAWARFQAAADGLVLETGRSE